MSEDKINVSFKKCCICNNSNIGEFTIINGEKYHLCCIEVLQQENTQLKQQLKDIEEYLESIKDMPDADMYIKLGEYEEFKHILDLIHKGSE